MKEMLEKGLHLDQATIEDMRMVTCHWLTKTNKPYIIVRLQNMKCRKLLNNKKKEMDKNYMPHGQRIFIREDLTKVNLVCVYTVYVNLVSRMVRLGSQKIQIEIKCYIPCILCWDWLLIFGISWFYELNVLVVLHLTGGQKLIV